MKSIIFLLGPTGTGKSAFAVKLARQTKSEIVNCDSQQVYKDLNIGTAKPTAGQLAEVPHHFYNFVAPGNQYTAGEYRRDILEFLDVRQDLSQLVFVGGSGFYAQSLLTEMYSSGKANEDIRQEVMKDHENFGLEYLFNELYLKDPVYAKKIGPRDRYRLLRSVEILRASGKTPTEMFAEAAKNPNPLQARGFKVRKFALYMDKELLRARILRRAEDMLRAGLIEETQVLLARGFANWRPLNSVGYKEVREWLEGKFSRDELPEKIAQNTMKLCKRQMTWLKRDREIEWLNAGSVLDSAQEVLSY